MFMHGLFVDSYLEVKGYPLCSTAAGVLFLEAVIELCQLRPLALCERAFCVRQQLHGSSQALMVLVVVRGELKQVPAS